MLREESSSKLGDDCPSLCLLSSSTYHLRPPSVLIALDVHHSVTILWSKGLSLLHRSLYKVCTFCKLPFNCHVFMMASLKDLIDLSSLPLNKWQSFLVHLLISSLLNLPLSLVIVILFFIHCLLDTNNPID